MRKLAKTATLAVFYPLRYYAFITESPVGLPAGPAALPRRGRHG